MRLGRAMDDVICLGSRMVQVVENKGSYLGFRVVGIERSLVPLQLLRQKCRVLRLPELHKNAIGAGFPVLRLEHLVHLVIAGQEAESKTGVVRKGRGEAL